MRKIFWAIGLFALFLAPAPCAAQSGATKVTIAARRITLDALVRKLARQSGLRLDVDPADPLSATPLLAYLTDVRTDTAATALADLLSTRRAAWRWERLADKPGEGEIRPADFKPGVAYRLRPSSGAKVYAAKARARIWQDLAGTISSSGGSAGTPDALTALGRDFQNIATELPSAITSPGPVTKEQLATMQKWFDAQRTASQRLMQAALARLSLADGERLMNGKEIRLLSERCDAPFADALRAAGELNASFSKSYVSNGDGTMGEVTAEMIEPPTYAVLFDTHHGPFAVAPSLNISVERSVVYKPRNNGFGGKSSSRGGAESVGAAADGRWRGILTKEWTPDPRETSAPLPDSLPLPELTTRPEINANTPNDKYASFIEPLLRLHKTATKNGKPLNLLARLATFRGGASDPFADENVKTLGAARKALDNQRAMPTRWAASAGSGSEAILLANALTHIWTSGPDKLVSPKYRADFDAARQRDPDNLVSLDLLCDAARRLGPDALYTLLIERDEEEENEKGEAVKPETDLIKALRTGTINEQFADFARKHHPLLALIGGNADIRHRIQGEAGINLADPREIAVRDAFAACDSAIQLGLTSGENAETLSPDAPPVAFIRLFTADKTSAPPRGGNGATPGDAIRRFIVRLKNENGEAEDSAQQYKR